MRLNRIQCLGRTRLSQRALNVEGLDVESTLCAWLVCDCGFSCMSPHLRLVDFLQFFPKETAFLSYCLFYCKLESKIK